MHQFFDGETAGLDRFNATMVQWPYGTSLRMSDLGYRNSDKAPVRADYTKLPGYVESLGKRSRRRGLPTRRSVERDGLWQQLNANMLQIENEYYAARGQSRWRKA